MSHTGEEYPVLSNEDVQRRLSAELPRWSLADGCLERVYRTSGWRASLTVANVIGHIAEAAWHHPEMHLSYYATTVKLKTRKKTVGITARDFALAKKIEEVVFWQPAKDGGPLRGIPEHKPQYKYLDYGDSPSED